MKIPSENYQFSNEKTIILVTGAQGALVYFANEGEVDLVSEIEADKIEDTDKSGIFRVKRPKMVHHGVSFEDKQEKIKDKTTKDFLKKLRVELKELKVSEGVDSVFLFTPDFMEGHILESFPSEMKDRVKNVFVGNYRKEHPLDLVKKIGSFRDDKRVKPVGEEALKILKKGKEDKG